MSDARSGSFDADATRDLNSVPARSIHDPSRDDGEPIDAIADEFAARCRAGEAPTIAEFERRFPEFAERLRRLLPIVALMEGIKHDAPDEPVVPLPQQMGEYRIVREMGRGGMGVVYEAVQESLDRHVALKVIHQTQIDAKRLRRFRREAEAVARLHHTNIVPIFGVGEHGGLPFYAMQLIRGRGLDVVVREWRRDGMADRVAHRRLVATLAMQAAEAIDYAHRQGILHRDVKPANLLLDEGQAVWVTDFGLAKHAGRDDLTATGDVIGTLRYLAPEALRGQTGPSSDVYSLGLTLYELLTLSPPFGDLSASELLRHVGQEQPTRPRTLDPGIPRDLETIVLKAIAKEPARRYRTAKALAEDLRRFLDDRPILARRASVVERAWRWSRRNRTTALLLATTGLVLLIAGSTGWVGYLTTNEALKRSWSNEKLALGIFRAMFEHLEVDSTFLPPPIGRTARLHVTRPGDLMTSLDGLPPARGVGPAPRREGMSPFPGAPPGLGPPPGIGPRREDPATLGDLLEFYDRFAAQNETNPRLRLEAARAYRRVGAIQESLGRADDAEQSYARAVAIIERLVAEDPGRRDYRDRVVEIDIMANPWTADASRLPRMEARLRRADLHADQLAATSTGGTDWILPMAHVQAKLATVLRRTGQPDEARSRYQRAIELTAFLVDREPENLRARLDLADSREALGLLEREQGNEDEALAHFEEVAEILTAIAEERLSPSLADRLADLADDFRGLGQADRADAIAAIERRERAESGRRGPPRDR